MSTALLSTLPATGHRNVFRNVRKGENWPARATAMLTRVEPSFRRRDTVRGKQLAFDLRTIVILGGGCKYASQEAAETAGEHYVAAYSGLLAGIISGGTRMIEDNGDVKAMVTERAVQIRDAAPEGDVVVIGSVPVLYDDFGLVQVERDGAVGAAVEVDQWKSIVNPNYDLTVFVEKGHDQNFGNADGGDYGGDLSTRYDFLGQLGSSECYQFQFVYDGGGAVTVTEIVESIKLVKSGALKAGATVVLLQGTGRNTDVICDALSDPAKRQEFCAKHFGGKEPVIATFGESTTAAEVTAYVNEFNALPDVVIVPLSNLRAVNLGFGFIRSAV